MAPFIEVKSTATSFSGETLKFIRHIVNVRI